MGEQKKKAMEEAERKRQEASDGKGKGPAIDAHKEISKTKEQVEAEMKISLSFRIKPLDLEAMDSDELKDKATELFNTILSLETEKYDCEQRRINQDYELKELKERQKVQLRQKAAKRRSPESTRRESGCSPSTREGRTLGRMRTGR